MKRFLRRISVAVIGVLSIGLILGLGAEQARAASGTCEDLRIPVSLSPGQPKNKVIAGTLCRPQAPTNLQTVDVLVPGGAYDSTYWDFPYNYPQYSYVERTLQAGRAAFNFDRLGTGESSRPLSALVTAETDAYAMHQAIQWLKANRGFSDVTAIGHSVGSALAIYEAAIYRDVNRLVATGLLHSPSINVILTQGTALQVAALDPQFANEELDPGYLTTRPGIRGQAFYSAAVDPGVVAYDEAHKSFISSVEATQIISQILAPPLLNPSATITVPVLTIVGDQDILCGPPIIGANCSSSETVRAYESHFYPRAQSYTAVVVPGTGHNLPLHPSADTSFAAINQWITAH